MAIGFSIDAPQIVIEAVKAAEDGKGIVLRLYEASGGACSAQLRSAFLIETAEETNMLERNAIPLRFDDHGVDLEFRAFEIKTVRIR